MRIFYFKIKGQFTDWISFSLSFRVEKFAGCIPLPVDNHGYSKQLLAGQIYSKC